MNPFRWWRSYTFVLTSTLLLATLHGTTITFTFINRCNYTVWPAIFVLSGRPMLNTTGFELPKDSSRNFQFPTGWAGRSWARTGCKLDQFGSWSCRTGDCGTRSLECNNSTPSMPITVAEFSLGVPAGGLNSYYVSLIYGFNVPMNFEAVGVEGSSSCGSAGCNVDLNRLCPTELAFGHNEGCLAPCEALGNSEYCCIGPYNVPNMCSKQNIYTEMFKDACPRSYCYASDISAMFVCNQSGDYVLTFCPSSSFSSSSSS